MKAAPEFSFRRSHCFHRCERDKSRSIVPISVASGAFRTALVRYYFTTIFTDAGVPSAE